VTVSSISIVDITPASESNENFQNAEPSLAVNPTSSSTQIIAGAFVRGSGAPPDTYWSSSDGGTTWTSFGGINHGDTTVAWLQQSGGTAVPLIVALDADVSSVDDRGNVIDVFSGGSISSASTPLFTQSGGASGGLDQPWLATGPNGAIYYTYNNTDATSGMTAEISFSSNGGSSFSAGVTLDRVGGSLISGGTPQEQQLGDEAGVRVAVNGQTVYAVFVRLTSENASNTNGTYNGAQVVVVRSNNAGADNFTALGSGGNGVQVASATYANGNVNPPFNNPLTLGQQRSGSNTSIAVDPNNSQHVVVAYPDSLGSIDQGVAQMVVSESFDGGTTWTEKFRTESRATINNDGLLSIASGGVASATTVSSGGLLQAQSGGVASSTSQRHHDLQRRPRDHLRQPRQRRDRCRDLRRRAGHLRQPRLRQRRHHLHRLAGG
jgi:autotransporter passenger strand-loop-strand repeat protein